MNKLSFSIKQALNELDPFDDSQWTAEGLPRMGAVEELVGDSSIKRRDVTNAAPEFSREIAKSNKDSVAVSPDEFAIAKDKDVDTAAKDTDEATVTENTEAVTSAKDTDEAYQELNEVALGLREELSQLAISFKEAEVHKKDTVAKLQKIEESMLKMYPNISNSDAIREYITSQQKIKAQRYSNVNEILKGINVNDLRTMSPLDASRKRAVGFGKKRVVYPVADSSQRHG